MSYYTEADYEDMQARMVASPDVTKDKLRATLNASGVIFHSPISDKETYVEFLDIMYESLKDNNWCVIFLDRAHYLQTVEFFKELDSMHFIKLQLDGDNLFKGPLGEDIRVARKVDRVRAHVRMNYK